MFQLQYFPKLYENLMCNRECSMSRSKKRVTIYDIAKDVNLSPTTVYRALNGKGRIKSLTQSIILESANRMGYRANLAASSMSRKTIKIGVVFDLYFPGFHDGIIAEMRDTFDELYDFKIEAVFAPLDKVYDKNVQINKLKSIARDVNAIIFSPWSSDEAYIDFIDTCESRNLPIFTLINDIPHSKRTGTIGTNSNMTGSVGAQLLMMLGSTSGNALFVSNKDILNQNELMHGFINRLKMTGNVPIGVYETQNDDRMGYYLTDKLLKDQPNISGIFVGISQSIGVCDRIVESGLTGRVKLVCVDIFEKMAEMIESDVVQATIYQQTKEIGREAVIAAYDYLVSGRANINVSLSKPQILIKSNYREYL